MDVQSTTSTRPLTANVRTGRGWPWPIGGRVLGIVLILASVLKAYELATVPLLGSGLLQQRWLLLTVIDLEFMFGGWLLVGMGGHRTWILTLVLWLTFFLTAGYEAVTGASTCGCFGRVEVNPWYTAVFDLAVVVLLPFCRPNQTAAPKEVVGPAAWRWGILGTFAVFGLAFGLWNIAHAVGERLDTDGLLVADGVTVLEPDKWAGKPFPLIKYIDVGSRLSKGDWLVLLYRYDCEHCQRAVPRFDALADTNAGGANELSIALVELPPYAPAGQKLYGPQTHSLAGRLTADREWFASTPVAIRLHDGRVQKAIDGDAAIDPSALMAFPPQLGPP